VPPEQQSAYVLPSRGLCQKFPNLYRREVPGTEMKTENHVLIDETGTMSQKVSYYALLTSNA